MKISESQRPMLGLVMGGGESNGSVWKNSGQPNLASTTTHRTQSQQLSELLSSLEREVESLNSKYCEAYVTLLNAMEILARLTGLLLNSSTTRIQDY
jgi:hypothetical protein